VSPVRRRDASQLERFGDARLTRIETSLSGELTDEDLIPDEDCVRARQAPVFGL